MQPAPRRRPLCTQIPILQKNVKITQTICLGVRGCARACLCSSGAEGQLFGEAAGCQRRERFQKCCGGYRGLGREGGVGDDEVYCKTRCQAGAQGSVSASRAEIDTLRAQEITEDRREDRTDSVEARFALRELATDHTDKNG